MQGWGGDAGEGEGAARTPDGVATASRLECECWACQPPLLPPQLLQLVGADGREAAPCINQPVSLTRCSGGTRESRICSVNMLLEKYYCISAAWEGLLAPRPPCSWAGARRRQSRRSSPAQPTELLPRGPRLSVAPREPGFRQRLAFSRGPSDGAQEGCPGPWAPG